MSDVNALIGKASFRKAVKELSDKDIQKIADNAVAILEEREAQAAEKEAEFAKRAALVTEVQNMLAASGMSKEEIEETLKTMAGSKKKSSGRSAVAPKYKISVDGEEHTWTGRGRTPAVFAEYLSSKGITKDQLPTVD